MKKKIKPIVMPTTGTKYFPPIIVEDKPKSIRIALKTPLTGKPNYSKKGVVGDEGELKLAKMYYNEIKKPKKRIPTRFNAKKLKEKHKDLWKTIEKLVYIDIDMLTEIYNGRRNIDEKKARTIAHNAAFTAIVEMIKRGLL